jgi:putative oxidoreductase
MKNFLNKYKDTGIFVLRVMVGISFALVYGRPKIEGGPEFWTMIGSSMSNVGITFAPAFWGFMASLAEFGGGILLILGLFTRPAAAFMAFTMVMAAIVHLKALDPWHNVVNPLNLLAVFIALIFLGAGKYSLDYLFSRKKNDENLNEAGR